MRIEGTDIDVDIWKDRKNDIINLKFRSFDGKHWDRRFSFKGLMNGQKWGFTIQLTEEVILKQLEKSQVPEGCEYPRTLWNTQDVKLLKPFIWLIEKLR